MPLHVNLQELEKLTDAFTYKKDGDKYEAEYHGMILDVFPSSETLWKKICNPHYSTNLGVWLLDPEIP